MGGFARGFFILIDSAIYNAIDNAYNLIVSIASTTLNNDIIRSVINNLYILVGIFAFFRIALLLINSIIDPEKLAEKGKGLSNILVRTVLMLVLLVLMPILFNMAYDLQGKVTGYQIATQEDVDEGKAEKVGEIVYNDKGNIIERLILGEAVPQITSSSGEATPGDIFRTSAISALITVDENFTEGDLQVPTEDNSWSGGYKANTETCKSSDCNSAITDWNEMYVNGKMEMSTLMLHIGASEKIDVDGKNQKVYVYNYSTLITTIVGGFMLYILVSFALDIALRVFELAALEIVSPVFVATIVDPKSTSSGMFSRWLKEVGGTYAGLFIRIVVLDLMVLFSSLISKMKFLEIGNNSSWVRLALVLGIMMFAKKAPKWIGDLLGVKSEGLGGLGIGKKISEGALGGALLAKGAKGLAGAGVAGGKNLGHLARNRLNNRRKVMDKVGKKGGVLTKNGRNQRYNELLNNIKNDPNNYRYDHAAKAKSILDKEVDAAKRKRKAAISAARESSDFKYGGRQTAGRIGNALLNGALTFKAAANADKLSGSLKVARDNSNVFKEAKGLKGDSWTTSVGDWYDKRKSKFNEGLYGNAQARITRADEEKDRRNYERSFKDISKLPEGFEIAKQTNYDGYTRVKDSNGVWHYGADHDERLAMIGMAMAGIKTSDIVLDESNRIIGIKGKDGEEDKKVSRGDVKNYAISATSQMPDYGLAQFQKYSADLESRLVTEYGSRTGDLNDLQAKLSNVASSIATATSRAMNGIFDKLKTGFNIPSDVNVGNLNARISEISANISRLGSIENPTPDITSQLASQQETLAELRNLSNAMTEASSISNGIAYKDGMVVINGDYDNPKSPEEFRSYIKNEIRDENQKAVLMQTAEFHISAAQAQEEMVQTQRHIEALNSTCENVGIMVDPVTGMQDNNKVIDGTYSQKVEIKVKKANDKYNAAFQAEKEKGNIKEGDA